MRTRLPHVAVAVLLGLAVAACGGNTASDTADHSTSPSTSTKSPSSNQSSSRPTSSPSSSGTAYAVYVVGKTPLGPRLFREFRPGTSTGSGPAAALQMLADKPLDPDYRTLWSGGSLSKATVTDGQIDVTVDSTMTQRPKGMSAKDAQLALQQVVYTAQAAAQQQLPVRFLDGDAPAPSVLGLPTRDPVAATKPLRVLALVNITEPEQGSHPGSQFSASGVASSFEGTVPWQVLDSTGKEVLSGAAQATGFLHKLYPWQVTVDASQLPAGTYTFVATTDDESGGEGPGPTKDTKTFTLP